MYVEIARGTPANRGILINYSDLGNYIEKDMALYRSVYLYGEDAKEYVKKTGSFRNFFGIRAIDKIPVDIDKGDNSNEKTLDILRSIIIELEAVGIGCGSFQPYFSGSGYHLMLSGELFNFKASPDLPYTVKQTLYRIIPETDISIYMRTGIYRVQHTINRKTGLYK